MLRGGATPQIGETVSLPAQTERAYHQAQQPEALFRLRRQGEAGQVSASPAAIDRRVEPFRTIGVSGRATATATATQSKAAEEIGAITSSRTREDTYGEAEAMAADERRSSPPSPLSRDAGLVGYHRRTARQGNDFSCKQSSFGDKRQESYSRGISCSWRPRQHTEDGIAAASRSLFIDDSNGESLSPTAPAYEPLPLAKASATAEIPRPKVVEARPKEWFGSSGVEETKQEQRQRLDAAAALAKLGGLTHGGEKSLSCGVAGSSSPLHQEVRETPRADQEHGSRQPPPQSQVPVLSSLEGERSLPRTIGREDSPSTMERSDNAYESTREELLRYMKGVRTR